MTSLAITLAVDPRGPSALYIITDSRITWGTSARRWDGAQKTFTSRSFDIFGFCGDAFFPPFLLRQVVNQLDLGLLSDASAVAATRHTRIIEAFRLGLKNRKAAPIEAFAFFHGARDGEGMQSTFHVWESRYYPIMDQLKDRKIDLPPGQSRLVHIDGTGDTAIKAKAAEWADTDARGTSRAAVSSFCDALRSGVDVRSGGAPQLIGLWRRGDARTFGFIWNSKKYVGGLELEGTADWSRVDWFNERFERCDGETGLRLDGAQVHTRPSNLGS